MSEVDINLVVHGLPIKKASRRRLCCPGTGRIAAHSLRALATLAEVTRHTSMDSSAFFGLTKTGDLILHAKDFYF